MNKYFPVVSKNLSARQHNEEKKHRHVQGAKYHPYARRTEDKNDNGNPTLTNYQQCTTIRSDVAPVLDTAIQADLKPTSSAITKYLLDTLSDPSNPITHSDIGKRSSYIVSTSTGHQVSEGHRDRRLYFEDRERKLDHQRRLESPSDEPHVLKNVSVYINGFLDGTTDIEMKRIVCRAGGKVSATASGCTHVLTSQHLSGSKTQRILTSKSRKKFQVVKPDWVFDSIKAGKKLPEREYAVINDTTTKNIYSMLQK